MSRITGNEKVHWHDQHGRHRLTDPRTHSGGDYPEKFWGSDERAYADHLRLHEKVDGIPQPREDDSETITALFTAIALAEKVIKAHRQLINALRGEKQ